MKMGIASGARLVRCVNTERSEEMFSHMGASRCAGKRPAIGGMGACDGRHMRETRRGIDEGYAAMVIGVSNDLTTSGQEIAS